MSSDSRRRLPPQRISLHSLCVMPPSWTPQLLATTSERLRATEADLEDSAR
jgi:hypothetical protein